MYLDELLRPLTFWSAHPVDIPWGHGRAAVNGREATQLMLVGHMTMTTWRMLYVWIIFLHSLMLYKTYFFKSCEVDLLI